MLKVLELFAGIGACSKALTNLGIEHEIVDCVEIDKYAVKSFNAVHGTDFEPQDITKWDKDIECDLIMHGSPCQDFSVAGKQAGGDKDSGTRSSLMYETLRIVDKLKPKYVIWENVKNLLSKKHRHNFDAYIEAMKELGYVNYYQVLNAKDYGIPQNRERVFTVSIREDIWDRTYDSFGKLFEFPKPFPLEKKLKDVLEEKVDEKYYISDAMMNYFMGVNQKPSKFPRKERFLANINRKNQDIGNSVTTNAGQRPTDNFVKIITANKTGYDLAKNGDGIDLAYPDSKTRRGRVGHGVSKTLPTSDSQGVLDGYRIRKLTPKECWRLMGFDDADFDKAEKVNSNAQLYKQAGNSIVVNVLEAILKELL
jgi:DNA (cytosine-5)-methyltransferase 1